MTGRKSAGLSGGIGGRARFPERLHVAVVKGTQAAVERAAALDGMSPAEWLRALVRRGLDASRKREERRKHRKRRRAK